MCFDFTKQSININNFNMSQMEKNIMIQMTDPYA